MLGDKKPISHVPSRFFLSDCIEFIAEIRAGLFSHSCLLRFSAAFFGVSVYRVRARLSAGEMVVVAMGSLFTP